MCLQGAVYNRDFLKVPPELIFDVLLKNIAKIVKMPFKFQVVPKDGMHASPSEPIDASMLHVYRSLIKCPVTPINRGV